LRDGYTAGYEYKYYINGWTFKNLDRITITPDGIRYLNENSMMKKVMDWAKTAKELIH
jgi:hypothetical protein